MEELKELLSAVDFNADVFWKAALLLTIGSLVLGMVGRYSFGKNSMLHHSVSSAIGILFVYAATVVLYSLGAQYSEFVAPLPFVSLSEETMTIFVFEGQAHTVICEQLINMIILSFLANLLDSMITKGEGFISWLFSRCLIIVLAILGQLGVAWLFQTYLPQGFLTYAPTIMLWILVAMLAVGAFKVLIGAAIATVNPIIGALYTFFFASVIGKALSTAVFTTMILGGLVWGLNYLGCVTVAIAQAALVAYIPLVIVLLVVWYIVNKVL